MDIKRLVSAMMISALVMLALMYIKPDLFGGKAPPPPETTTSATLTSAAPVALPPGITAPAVAPQEFITLGSAVHGSGYKLEVVVNNQHASVARVHLNIDEYAETVKRLKPLDLLEASPHAIEPFATTDVKVNGAAISLLHNLAGAPLTWYVDKEHTSATKATLYAVIFTDLTFKTPWLRIEKTFEIDPKNYEVKIAHRIINLLKDPVNVQIDQMGPIDLWNKPPDDYRTDSRSYQAATYTRTGEKLSADAILVVHPELVRTPKAGTSATKDLGNFSGPTRTVWVAASNRFFTTIVRPLPQPDAPTDPLGVRKIPQIDFLESAEAEPLWVAPVAADSVTGMRLTGKPVLVAGNAARDLGLSLYMGPKKRDILAGDPAAAPGTLAYDYNLYDYMGVVQLASRGCYSFCTLSWINPSYFPDLALIILKALAVIHVVTHNWGVAIIILVIIVRLLMHPLTRSSQVNMAKMQQKMAAVQPELDRIKKKYPKDNAMQQQEKMRIFKEHKINPAGTILGCLPMMLQMPIWLALYAGLAVDINLRQQGFIPGWITDLSNPDMLFPQDHPYFTLPLLGPVYGLNLLPILLGVVFFLQMRYSMKSSPKPTDPQQAQTQKISQFMFLLFPVMLYNAPSGLNLYIFASSIAGFFDTWLVRRHLKEKGILPAQMGPTL